MSICHLKCFFFGSDRRHWSLLIFVHFGDSSDSESRTPCMLLLDSLENADPKRLEPEIRKYDPSLLFLFLLHLSSKFASYLLVCLWSFTIVSVFTAFSFYVCILPTSFVLLSQKMINVLLYHDLVWYFPIQSILVILYILFLGCLMCRFVVDIYKAEGRKEDKDVISRIPLLIPKVLCTERCSYQHFDSCIIGTPH